MKENDIVRLIKLNNDFIGKNLYDNIHGIILKTLPNDKFLVIFFNDKLIGDYAVVEVNKSDIEKENIELPLEIIEMLRNSGKISEEELLKKQSLEKLVFDECDLVELLVEKEAYSQLGIHKGDTGVIALDYAVNDEILVDFSGVDDDGNYYGDCISVNIHDLKLIK